LPILLHGDEAGAFLQDMRYATSELAGYVRWKGLPDYLRLVPRDACKSP
jgi:hypothetical protein